MQVAQKLYEGIDIGGETVGLITYMRTDGVQMAPEAIDAARVAPSASQFGDRYRAGKATLSIRPRPRMPRKPTKPFARPTSTARRTRCAVISMPTSCGSTT